ncbi:MAG: ATP-binding cassette domain-containing protein, partial [Aestuariivirgaceae bacterium]
MSLTPAREESGLRLQDLNIAINGKTLVSLSLAIGPGEIMTVMGPSGAGKSALLAYVSGMLKPIFAARGEVWLGSRRIDMLPAHLRRTGL